MMMETWTCSGWSAANILTKSAIFDSFYESIKAMFLVLPLVENSPA